MPHSAEAIDNLSHIDTLAEQGAQELGAGHELAIEAFAELINDLDDLEPLLATEVPDNKTNDKPATLTENPESSFKP